MTTADNLLNSVRHNAQESLSTWSENLRQFYRVLCVTYLVQFAETQDDAGKNVDLHRRLLIALDRPKRDQYSWTGKISPEDLNNFINEILSFNLQPTDFQTIIVNLIPATFAQSEQ